MTQITIQAGELNSALRSLLPLAYRAPKKSDESINICENIYGVVGDGQLALVAGDTQCVAVAYLKIEEFDGDLQDICFNFLHGKTLVGLYQQMPDAPTVYVKIERDAGKIRFSEVDSPSGAKIEIPATRTDTLPYPEIFNVLGKSSTCAPRKFYGYIQPNVYKRLEKAFSIYGNASMMESEDDCMHIDFSGRMHAVVPIVRIKSVEEIQENLRAAANTASAAGSNVSAGQTVI